MEKNKLSHPNIDKLASEGILFERAYCQQAVCGPSRVSLLSGCRPDTTGVYTLQTSLREAMPDVISLPQHFKDNGYETRSIGKIYHHRNDDLEGWSKPPYSATGDWQGRGYLTDEAIEMMLKNIPTNPNKKGNGPAVEGADVSDNGFNYMITKLIPMRMSTWLMKKNMLR